MLVPAQAVGNAAVQAGGPSDGGSAEAARLRETAQAIAQGEENGAPAPVVQAETQKAIQPTPVTAKAVRVEMDADRATKEGVVQYPITGPDKFARTIAEAKREAYEIEQREAAGEAIGKAIEARTSSADAATARAERSAAPERVDAEDRPSRSAAADEPEQSAVASTKAQGEDMDADRGEVAAQ